MSRIFIRAHVVPGPAVESALTHTRNEVGDEIIAEAVALVGRAIQVPRQRVHGESDAVSQPACEYSPIPALWVEHDHGRAIGLVAPRTAQAMLRSPTFDRGGIAFAQSLPIIRCRPNRDKHLAAVLGESNVARNVAALH